MPHIFTQLQLKMGFRISRSPPACYRRSKIGKLGEFCKYERVGRVLGCSSWLACSLYTMSLPPPPYYTTHQPTAHRKQPTNGTLCNQRCPTSQFSVGCPSSWLPCPSPSACKWFHSSPKSHLPVHPARHDNLEVESSGFKHNSKQTQWTLYFAQSKEEWLSFLKSTRLPYLVSLTTFLRGLPIIHRKVSFRRICQSWRRLWGLDWRQINNRNSCAWQKVPLTLWVSQLSHFSWRDGF